MKVLFIYPDLSLGSRGKFYHGIAYLSAVLKQFGHLTSLIHIFTPIANEEFANLVDKEFPQLVAFSTTTNMFRATRQYAKLVKKKFLIPTVCGGIHPTIVPEEVISCPEIDMVCIGEGEFALLELCNKMSKNEDICDINNLWVKKDGRVYRNSLRPAIQNLDELPFPDRGIYNYASLEDTKLNRAAFMASRGCPYSCSYCCNHRLRQIYPVKYVRFRSVDNVITEIDLVNKEHPVEYIVFHDDIFTLNKGWLSEFSQNYHRKINLPFTCNSRVDLLDREIVSLLKSAGCKGINMGIESGNDYIRQNVLNRNITKQQIIDAFKLCREFDIKAASYNMVGLPFENLEKILDTIKLNAQIKPNFMQVSIFFPYPATKLYEVCERNDFFSNIEVDNYFEKSTLCQPYISSKQINFAFYNFEFMVKLYCFINKFSGWLRKSINQFFDKLFISGSPLISLASGILVTWKRAKYYLITTIKYYKRYGLNYVIRRIVKKIF